MKSVTIKGHVMTEPVSRTTKSGQLMCSFLLAGRSPTALSGADDCSDENGIYSVACWGSGALNMRFKTFFLISLLRIPRVAFYLVLIDQGVLQVVF